MRRNNGRRLIIEVKDTLSSLPKLTDVRFGHGLHKKMDGECLNTGVVGGRGGYMHNAHEVLFLKLHLLASLSLSIPLQPVQIVYWVPT